VDVAGDLTDRMSDAQLTVIDDAGHIQHIDPPTPWPQRSTDSCASPHLKGGPFAAQSPRGTSSVS
jgi:hypothetical protein